MELEKVMSGLEHLRKSYLNELLQLGGQYQWMILGSSAVPLKRTEVEELLRQNISQFTKGQFCGENYLRHRVRQILWERMLDEQDCLLKDTGNELNQLAVWWIPFEDGEDILRHLTLSPKLQEYPETKQMAFRRGWNECSADWMKNSEKIALWASTLRHHIRHCPVYIALLRQEWLNIIQAEPEGVLWQAGWMGLTVVGDTRDEPVLARIMKEKLEMYARTGPVESRKWMDVMSVMVKWRPKNAALRRKVQRWWKGLEKITGEGLWKWQAAFLLENNEEKLFQHLQHMEEPWTVFTEVDPWRPRNSEIRRKVGEFWIDLLLTRGRHNPTARKIIWESLVQLDSQDKKLIELLEIFLPVEEHQPVLEVFVRWLEKHGLPPATENETCHRLLEGVMQRMAVLEADGKCRDISECLSGIAFYLLIYSAPPETESEAGQKWRQIFPAIEKTSLATITWWCKRTNPEKVSPWYRLVQKLWKEQLLVAGRRGKRDALHYLLWLAREDDTFPVSDELWEEIRRILEEEDDDDVYLAAVLLARYLARQGPMHRLKTVWKSLVGRKPEIHVRGVSLALFFMREFLYNRIENFLSNHEENGRRADQFTLFRLLRQFLHVFPGKSTGDNNLTSVARRWEEEMTHIINTVKEGFDEVDGERQWQEQFSHL